MHRYQPSGTATIIVLAQENPKQTWVKSPEPI